MGLWEALAEGGGGWEERAGGSLAFSLEMPTPEKTLGTSNCLEPHLPVPWILIHNRRRENVALPYFPLSFKWIECFNPIIK